MSWAPPPGAVAAAAAVGVQLVGSDPLRPDDPRVARHPLGAVDRARRDAFRLPGDRARFVTGRVLVAEHLTQRYGLGPADYVLRRRTDQAGEWRPVLVATRAGVPPLPHFSIAHSGERVLLAVCADREVGVDVEELRSFRDMPAEVEQQFLTPAELRALPAGTARTRAVAATFSRKEAVLKATGFGLAISPLTLHLGQDDRGRPAVVDFADPRAVAVRLTDLDLGTAHVAALAVC